MSDLDERFVLVVNPKAGAGRAERVRRELESALRHAGGKFDTLLTNGPGHATELVRIALHEGVSGVAVVGGDGTLNEAVNGFFDGNGHAIGSGQWLGPLPVGTGGDFRRTLQIPRSVEGMARAMMHAIPRAIDAGWLTFQRHDGTQGKRAFVNIASFGMGGKVDQLVNGGPKWIGGTPAFLLGTLRAIAVYRNQRVRLVIDGGPAHEADISNVAIANGCFFGGGMCIAPKAEIDDGQFDIVSLEGLSAVAQLRLAPSLYRGTILGHKGVWHARGSCVEAYPMDEHKPILLDVDGEAPGSLPATFELRPGAILLRA